MGTGGWPPPRGPWVRALILLLCPEFLTGFTEASRIIYSEVTVPRRLEAKDGTFTEGYTSYLITAEGNHHIVHLTRAKNLIAKDIPVFTYSPEGDLITEFPYIQDDCYYKGFVEGSPGSIVSLSTCFGISGVLQIGDLRYEIEPVENSSTFQHLIYRRALEGGSRQLCQVPEEHKDHLPEYGELANRSHKILVIEEVPGLQMLPVPTRYLELALVTNKELFKVKNYNETLMLHLFISISNLLNTVYRRMKLQIVISAVEMWTRTDQVTAARSLARTLQVFAAWCQRDAVGRMNYDHIQLLLGQHYKERGFAWKGTMCQTDSMGVVSFPGHDTISDMMMLAHEIGHSLGFSHDDAKQFQNKFCNCNCTQRGCIMRTSPGSCLAFSNCTMGEYYDEVIRKNLPCLLNIPSLKPFLLELCGNGVLEKEEECDCGSDEACLQEGCCFSSSCLLTPGASCYRGECCHKCQFQPAGKICREDRSICDLPEYCNGSSGSCPMDVFKQDGTLCGDNNRCYDGHCHSHEAQCKALFGRAAHRAPLSCFREVNVRGDRCGNCGWNGTYYTKCLEENVLCGRVQCANIKRVPVRQDSETVVQTTMNDQLCWGLEFHLAPDTPDEGSVKDGTSCGRNKICMNRTCVNAAFLNSDCREKKCNGRGVCNNKKNCHCDFGWAPPDCKLEGFGGSVDSGPPPPSHRFCDSEFHQKSVFTLWKMDSFQTVLLFQYTFLKIGGGRIPPFPSQPPAPPVLTGRDRLSAIFRPLRLHPTTLATSPLCAAA
ncbi:PREDICTED: disintegrin and metalloproteinase domain-containing protein 9-like [Haliaeetus leucocephalus]|uniref:disintegrin and metalloproteinase domain-containing protein 9-like n=1 Tax=Haliaeetus leucocephalus TaxID=52644 RepID=UPI00053CCE09|nr:PREDICTED: disintegrin and metalloproteinase domain-containing protein 9-like [Haliaeetus leucocephalus]